MAASDLLTIVARWLYSRAMSRGSETSVPVQSGALAYRRKRSKKAEVLLVTGRRSGRWMIPKGWPMAGRSLAEAAAREAFEEAGISGTVDPRPLGSFHHSKRGFFGTTDIEILVHSLSVEKELSDWPER